MDTIKENVFYLEMIKKISRRYGSIRLIVSVNEDGHIFEKGILKMFR